MVDSKDDDGKIRGMMMKAIEDARGWDSSKMLGEDDALIGIAGDVSKMKVNGG